jgi:hypothetical protein
MEAASERLLRNSLIISLAFSDTENMVISFFRTFSRSVRISLKLTIIPFLSNDIFPPVFPAAVTARKIVDANPVVPYHDLKRIFHFNFVMFSV